MTQSAGPSSRIPLYVFGDRVRVATTSPWSGTILKAEVRAGDFVYQVRQDRDSSGRRLPERARVHHWVAAPWLRKLTPAELYGELEMDVLRRFMFASDKTMGQRKDLEEMDRLWMILSDGERKEALARGGRHAKSKFSGEEIGR